MITSNDIIIIREACARFEVTVPKPVLEAELLRAFAGQLLDEIRAEVAPDLENLTRKNLRDTHAQMVARTTWQVRERAAVDIEATTVQACILAWHQAAGGLCEALRAPFDKAADLFSGSFSILGGVVDADRAIELNLHAAHQSLTSSAADLSVLAIARNSLANSLPFDSGRGHLLDSFGRICTLPDLRTLNRRLFTPDGKYGVDFWAALAALPGVTLRWHTPADQQTQQSLPADAA